jgi:hypothetical protein
MASDNFWTTPTYAPMQQFKFDVQTNLAKLDIAEKSAGGFFQISDVVLDFQIPKELIKAVNLPDTTFSYDNDAANIGSGGPNIESQDPQMSELELQFYMTPELMIDLQDIFYTYYSQLTNPDELFDGLLPKITNKDRISFQPLYQFIESSNILVNIRGNSGEVLRTINYYGVYPTSYNFGNLEYSSSDVVVGSMKFYFYGYEITTADESAAGKLSQKMMGTLSLNRLKTDMGNF